MTDRLRSGDGDRILRHAIGVLTALKAAKVDEVRRALDEARDGMRGTDYDALPSGGGSSSPTERAALGEAPITAEALDRALLDIERVVLTLGLTLPWAPSKPRTALPRPGIGPCPPGKCEDHWHAGFAQAASQKRTLRWCRRCGDHRAEFGMSMPVPVIQAAEATRKGTADGRIDWAHWSIARAWDACGGKPTKKEKAG